MEALDTTNKPKARVSERNSLDFIQKVAPFDLFLDAAKPAAGGGTKTIRVNIDDGREQAFGKGAL